MRFDIQWQEAPSVQPDSERLTWARIGFFVGEECLTQLYDPRTQGVREGYDGSVLPLAEWLAEHGLRLIHERRLPSAGSEAWLDWSEAHAFRVARAGGAMPDIVARRTNDDVVELELRGTPSPPGVSVRFLSHGRFRLNASEFERGVFELLRIVDERFAATGTGPTESYAKHRDRLRDSLSDPRAVAAARLGLRTIAESLTQAEVAIAEASALEEPAQRIEEARRVAASLPAPPGATQAWSHLRRAVSTVFAAGRVPWLTGWDAAGTVRDRLGLKPDDDLSQVESLVGTLQVRTGTLLGTAVDTIHVRDEDGPPIVMTVRTREAAQRFRAARGLFHGLFSGRARLIAESPLVPTPEANAFAAELIAPVSRLRRQRPVNGLWSDAEVQAIARELRADPKVVEHQIQNHHEELGQLITDGP